MTVYRYHNWSRVHKISPLLFSERHVSAAHTFPPCSSAPPASHPIPSAVERHLCRAMCPLHAQVPAAYVALLQKALRAMSLCGLCRSNLPSVYLAPNASVVSLEQDSPLLVFYLPRAATGLVQLVDEISGRFGSLFPNMRQHLFVAKPVSLVLGVAQQRCDVVV